MKIDSEILRIIQHVKALKIALKIANRFKNEYFMQSINLIEYL